MKTSRISLSKESSLKVTIILSLFVIFSITTACYTATKEKANPFKRITVVVKNTGSSSDILYRGKMMILQQTVPPNLLSHPLWKNQLFKKQIFSVHFAPLLSNSRIIKGADVKRATVICSINVETLKRRAREVYQKYNGAKFLILIDEEIIGENRKPWLSETAVNISSLLIQQGLPVYPIKMTSSLKRKNPQKFNAALSGKLSDEQMKKLSTSTGSVILIYGSTRTHDQSSFIRRYSPGMSSISALIRLKAINLNTGQIIAGISTNKPGIHINKSVAASKAIKRALRKVFGSFLRQIAKGMILK